MSETQELHCPKCGDPARNAYALLGHIYTHHWILDEGELPDGFKKERQEGDE